MQKKYIKTDLCVVGGGLSGMCAAISAARKGLKTVLMHDRPVLGGNASSEMRVRICGASAHASNTLEAGILEEIQLENMYRNPQKIYSIWDSILFGITRFQKNLTLLLNCSCNALEMDNSRIKNIKGWQLSSETTYIVEAAFFADCSGDSILAPLSGAEFKIGREAENEFSESIAPEQADDITMGMSCLLQARQYDYPQKYIPPTWARIIEDDTQMPYRDHSFKDLEQEKKGGNFWFLELGGTKNTIDDTEDIRDELLKLAFGVWDHVKNRGDHGAENWALDWVGFLPGKRESRRYVGDYILNQNDVRNDSKFRDIIAYGGWPMDDHVPEGFDSPMPPTVFHEAACPYSIPYRCLYSKNIENLFFAGRNISCTHTAMSSSRVMATCAMLGQAVGNSAAIAVENQFYSSRQVNDKIEKLQQALLDDDCYLPGISRKINPLSKKAQITSSSGDPEQLRNGIDRPLDKNKNCLECQCGDWVQYDFEQLEKISEVRIVFDSDLNRDVMMMKAMYFINAPELSVPPEMVKSFLLEYQDASGIWHLIHNEINNYKRLFKISVNIKALKVRLTINDSWGKDNLNIFAFELKS